MSIAFHVDYRVISNCIFEKSLFYIIFLSNIAKIKRLGKTKLKLFKNFCCYRNFTEAE